MAAKPRFSDEFIVSVRSCARSRMVAPATGKHEQALTVLRQIPREVNPALVGHNTAKVVAPREKDEAAALIVELLRDYPQDEGGVFSSIQALLAAAAGMR